MATTISCSSRRGQETILIGADRIPGGQALNIGGEEVFARNRDAHLEDRAQDGVVGGRTAGAVLRANDNGKIIDYFVHETPQWFIIGDRLK